MIPQHESEAQADAASDAFGLIQQLVDRWCERRSLTPLPHLLPVYPLHTPHTDGWFDLYRGLKDMQVFCRSELLSDEQEMLRAACSATHVLNQRLGHAQWHV